MRKDEIIKERIKADVEIFKVIVIVVIALAGGNSGLLIKLYEDPSNLMLRTLFEIGFVFLIIFTFIAFYIYLEIKKLFKRL